MAPHDYKSNSSTRISNKVIQLWGKSPYCPPFTFRPFVGTVSGIHREFVRVMKRVLLYLSNQTVAMSASLTKDLFWVACQYVLNQDQQASENNNGVPKTASSTPANHVQLVSLDGQPVQCSSGNTMTVDCGLNDIDPIDDIGLVVLCAFWGRPKDVLTANRSLKEHLQKLHSAGIPIAGISNGQYFMAEAGLLDDKQATIYPMVVDSFKKRYPKVNLTTDRAITNAGNLYCSNGIPSSCDLIIAMIEKIYGGNIARKISKEFLIGFDRTYTLSNIEFDGQKYHGDKDVLAAQSYLESHYASSISIESLANRMNMSPRNLSRRFSKATGESPSQYLQRLRIQAAKELLLDSTTTVAEISYQVGYEDVSHFSRLFQKHEGCPPQIFRSEALTN